jgi:hypothetical protein
MAKRPVMVVPRHAVTAAVSQPADATAEPVAG